MKLIIKSFIDQSSLFESIMSGKYEYDEDYWSHISESGTILAQIILYLLIIIIHSQRSN